MQIVQVIYDFSDLVLEHYQQRRHEHLIAIEATANQIEGHLTEWKRRLETRLREKLAPWEEKGIPPDFVSIAGQSRLEKPLNKLLAWWSDPDAPHGLSSKFLSHLADCANLNSLRRDLENNERQEVYSEKSIDDHSRLEPDLLIRTKHSVLLLENKLRSGESGDQFSKYLDELTNNWSGEREWKAILCAPDDRKPPKGWHKTITHSQIAGILRELSQDGMALS